MVYSTRLAEGVKGPEGCPSLNPEEIDRLKEYLEPFKLEY
jgi:hypothetical protein